MGLPCCCGWSTINTVLLWKFRIGVALKGWSIYYNTILLVYQVSPDILWFSLLQTITTFTLEMRIQFLNWIFRFKYPHLGIKLSVFWNVDVFEYIRNPTCFQFAINFIPLPAFTASLENFFNTSCKGNFKCCIVTKRIKGWRNHNSHHVQCNPFHVCWEINPPMLSETYSHLICVHRIADLVFIILHWCIFSHRLAVIMFHNLRVLDLFLSAEAFFPPLFGYSFCGMYHSIAGMSNLRPRG